MEQRVASLEHRLEKVEDSIGNLHNSSMAFVTETFAATERRLIDRIAALGTRMDEQRATDSVQRGTNDATVEEHTGHLTRINGSIDRFADVVASLTTSIQTLQATVDTTTAIRAATDAALREQDEQRRQHSADTWRTPSRILAVVSVLVAIGSVAIATIALTRHGP